MMAVNTAYVASSELMERVAHRYGFHWIIKTNKRQSLYRIHIANAIFYTFIIYLTGGNQTMLAEMYAPSGCWRVSPSTWEACCSTVIPKGRRNLAYNTSRLGTLRIFLHHAQLLPVPGISTNRTARSCGVRRDGDLPFVGTPCMQRNVHRRSKRSLRPISR
jgi:hypothetical protein